MLDLIKVIWAEFPENIVAHSLCDMAEQTAQWTLWQRICAPWQVNPAQHIQLLS